MALTEESVALDAHDPLHEVPASAVRPLSLRPGTLERRALVDQLVATAPGTVVALTAPAAYGKTTTLALWNAADPRPFAWVNLTPVDDDPIHLLRHIGAALDSVAPLSHAERTRWSGPGRLVDRHLVPAVESALAARAPCVLVIDDVHVLRSPVVHDALRQLQRSLPPGCVLALAGRSVPVPVVARARMDDRLVEITPSDLALTGEEAVEFFRREGLALEEPEVATLVERTEGWVGGLHLGAVALLGRDDAVETFTGRNHMVADYLVEEVLLGLDPTVTEFLEESSLLDRMNAAMLDEVLERSDSALVLDEIHRNGRLLLVALDDERHWYRYNALLRDVLVERALRRDPLRCRQIRRRGSDAFADRGDLETAIDLAVAAGDDERGADLALSDLVETVQEGRFGRLQRRLDVLGPTIAERCAAGAVASAWCGLGTGDVALLRRGFAATARHDPLTPLADGSPTLAANLAILRMLVAPQGLEGAIADARAVIAAGPPASNPWWVAAMAGEGGIRCALGEDEAARRQLEAVLPHAVAEPTSTTAVLAQLALLAHRRGDEVEATWRSGQAMEVADRHHLDASVICIAAYAVAAMLAARAGAQEEFRARQIIAVDLQERLGPLSARSRMLTDLCLADGLLALGDREAARRHLASAAAAHENDPSATRQAADLAELAERLRGPNPADLGITDAEAKVLMLLDSHLSLGEIGAELYVSRNTVKSHSVAIYRKLGVSSRSDAVRAARRAGLLR